MPMRYLLMLAASLAFAGNAFAGDGEALAKKSHCTTCHGIDKSKVGPSFMEIAAKYKDDKNAQAFLEMKVRNGGEGVWGDSSMKATTQSVSDEDIKNIVQWVLSLK
jgi:cytochrome c